MTPSVPSSVSRLTARTADHVQQFGAYLAGNQRYDDVRGVPGVEIRRPAQEAVAQTK
jgi:hypothetical protein